jgi:hypothetical protein
VSQCRLLKGFVLFLIITSFSYCTKIKGTDIGAELIPAIDNVYTFDTTLEIQTFNQLVPDSMLPRLGRDASGNTGDYALGIISNNFQFGKTKASIFVEFKPTVYPFSFENIPDSLYFDSAVVCLRYTSTFGDTNAIQTISIYKINELLKGDSAYQTNKVVTYSEKIGSSSFAPSVLNDSLYLFRQNINNQLRIKIDKQFAAKLLTFDTSKLSPLNNDSTFRDYLKGFAIVPESNGSANALMNFNVSDTASYFRLYYRVMKNGIIDSTFKDLKFNRALPSAAVNRIERNYTGSEILKNFTQNTKGDSLVFIQATPGSYAMLKIQGIDDFKKTKGNVMVHLAEIQMEEVVTPGRQQGLFYAPLFMYSEVYDTASNAYYPFLSDGFTSGTFDIQTFGGLRTYKTDNSIQQGAKYKMNITRYVQGIITRNFPNTPIRLSAPYSVKYDDLYISFALNNLCAGNVVLGGGNNSSKKMKLRLVYSKL